MENFNYQSVPFHHLYCPNPSCARNASCLRHLAIQHVPTEVAHVVAVDPANYPTEADQCAYFRNTEKQRYAWDIGSLFDSIPYKKAVYLKRKMHDLYPRTAYYRILHQKYALSPGEQEEIVTLFPQTGISEVPVFNRYTDEYDWDEQHTPKGNTAP